MIPHFSLIRNLRDRKAIKARNEARRLAHPLPATPSDPVDIIANEVRTNRWHRRHSSIASAKVQSLLNVTNSPNKGDDAEYSFYYTDNLEEKRGSLETETNGRSRGDVAGKKPAEESRLAPDDWRVEEEERSRKTFLEDNALSSSPVKSGLSDTGKTRQQRESEAAGGKHVSEKTKNRLESLSGVDNPAVHLKDESPYSYDFSEQWIRNGSGALEMVNMGSRDFSKHHHQLKNQHEPPQIKNQRYIFHPARNSREDITDLSLSGSIKTARLARFDSDDSSEFTPAHDLRNSRASKAHQKPPRQHQQQQQSQHQRQLQNMQQQSRREREGDYEKLQNERRWRHQDQSYFYNEEIDLSPRKLLTTMSSRTGYARHAPNLSEERYQLEAGRRNSYASALDNNEENLYFAVARSRSIADLSSSTGPGHARLRNNPQTTSPYGRVNNAFSHSMEQRRFVDF